MEEKKITLYEDELYTKKVKEEATLQLLVFRLSNEWYGIDVVKTKEVVKIEKVVYLPSSPHYILGVINLRGTILSVTDLKKLFVLGAEPITDSSRIVVVELGSLQTGLLTDEVYEVIQIFQNKIDPALSTLSPEKAEYIEGEYKLDDKLIGILNVDKIIEKCRLK